MNENINLCEVLKGLEGIELYSPLFGEVILREIKEEDIVIDTNIGIVNRFNIKGQYYGKLYPGSECTLFPSKDQRDWSKFKRPIPVGTPMMCKLRCGDWILRYYAGFINGKHRVYRKDNSIADGYQRGMIPYNKFNPLNIEESLKYNIQK